MVKILFVTLWVTLCTSMIYGQEISDANVVMESHFSLKIEGFKKAKGEVRIAVFDSKESYTKDPVYAVVIPVEKLECTWEVTDLPYGEYAIAVYHDVNVNGKLDTNFLGIPKERYGFSNNARGRFGPAKWKDAKFSVDGATTEATIRIK